MVARFGRICNRKKIAVIAQFEFKVGIMQLHAARFAMGIYYIGFLLHANEARLTTRVSAFPVHALWTISIADPPFTQIQIRTSTKPQSASTPAQRTSAIASCFLIRCDQPQLFSSHAPKILN
jgi:hypothetical protein